MRPIRKLLKLPLLLALKSEWLRGKIVYELRKDFFRNLQIAVPLSHGTHCPLGRHDYIYSFSEVFVAGEYGDFLNDIPLPRRWLDLGCHAGFFSLYLAWQWRRAGSEDFQALLMDGDPRVRSDVLHLIQSNGLEKQLKFELGMIGQGSGEKAFALRDGMGSSSELGTYADSVIRVALLQQEQIASRFEPPYDLIKVDIEGAEFDLIESYPLLLQSARHILIEWHSWDAAGTGEQKIKNLLAEQGFKLERVLQPRKTHLVEGKHLTTGCHLYANNSARKTAPKKSMEAIPSEFAQHA